MSSESDTEFKNESNSLKEHAIRTEADIVHYRIKGAEREKALPPKDDSPEEEKQPSKEKKENFLQKMIQSFSSLLQSKKPEHSASSPANSLPETASPNSIADENLDCVNAQTEVKDETAAQVSGYLN